MLPASTTNEIRRIENNTFMNDKDTRLQIRLRHSKAPELEAPQLEVRRALGGKALRKKCHCLPHSLIRVEADRKDRILHLFPYSIGLNVDRNVIRNVQVGMRVPQLKTITLLANHDQSSLDQLPRLVDSRKVAKIFKCVHFDSQSLPG